VSFVNLPETRKSRFGEELNAEKMKKAVWLKPEVRAQIEFLEWTEGDRLRHSKFAGLREIRTLEASSRSTLAEGNSCGALNAAVFNVVILERVDAVFLFRRKYSALCLYQVHVPSVTIAARLIWTFGSFAVANSNPAAQATSCEVTPINEERSCYQPSKLAPL